MLINPKDGKLDVVRVSSSIAGTLLVVIILLCGVCVYGILKEERHGKTWEELEKELIKSSNIMLRCKKCEWEGTEDYLLRLRRGEYFYDHCPSCGTKKCDLELLVEERN